jgi:predicted nucleic acid-binding protein
VRAIDTNVIVRFLTADDPKQAQAARRVIEAGKVFIGTTVALETEWVLRAGYRFSSPEIVAALRGLGGLPRRWTGWAKEWISRMPCILPVRGIAAHS